MALCAASPGCSRLFHAPFSRNCIDPAAWLPLIPNACSNPSAETPRRLAPAAVAPKIPGRGRRMKPTIVMRPRIRRHTHAAGHLVSRDDGRQEPRPGRRVLLGKRQAHRNDRGPGVQRCARMRVVEVQAVRVRAVEQGRVLRGQRGWVSDGGARPLSRQFRYGIGHRRGRFGVVASADRDPHEVQDALLGVFQHGRWNCVGVKADGELGEPPGRPPVSGFQACVWPVHDLPCHLELDTASLGHPSRRVRDLKRDEIALLIRVKDHPRLLPVALGDG